MIELRLPDAGTPALLARLLRQSDREELDALQRGLDHEQVLRRNILLSVWARALWRGDCPLALTGVAPNGDGTHAPWLLGTDAIGRFPLAFMRCCREMLERVYLPLYAPLCNYVDARQARSIRFLRKLGFTLHAAEPCGAEGNFFHRFTMG